MNVEQYYAQEIKARGYQSDNAQMLAIKRFQHCYDEWCAYKNARTNIVRRFINMPNLPRGVYLWGGVGRGKSFLMDSFYAVLPIPRKTRLHFHEFMREVHQQLEALRGLADPLNELARRIAKKYKLICFDEFHISDIADAMILYRLLESLFKYGVQFVITSNYHPDTLYPDGLHRDRLLPAIELIKIKLDILNVDSGVDYRQQKLSGIKSYHTPLSVETNSALRHIFENLAGIKDESPILKIEQRELHALRRANGVVWFDFSTLCDGPRSQNDYLELAKQFHAIIVSNIPQLMPKMSSAARRFTWLIDILYDYKVKLFISAAVKPIELYLEGPMANEFQRTVSRLNEMQSEAYLASAHRNSVTMLA